MIMNRSHIAAGGLSAAAAAIGYNQMLERAGRSSGWGENSVLLPLMEVMIIYTSAILILNNSFFINVCRTRHNKCNWADVWSPGWWYAINTHRAIAHCGFVTEQEIR
jgi:hypothetical protein